MLNKMQPLPVQKSTILIVSVLVDTNSTAQSTSNSVSGRGMNTPGGVKNLSL